MLITINACLTHSSPFLPGAFFSRPMWLWMGVAVVKTFNRNQESSFSMFLFDFSEAQLLKCHQKFLNLKIALTPKVHFVWRGRMLRSVKSLSLQWLLGKRHSNSLKRCFNTYRKGGGCREASAGTVTKMFTLANTALLNFKVVLFEF